MSEELYFNDELRKCLNAAGLSDCGENDAWNYWYHRVHKAHDQAVDRVTEAQRAENAKLREMVVTLMACVSVDDCDKCPINGAEFKVSEVRCCYAAKQRMRELGVDA